MLQTPEQQSATSDTSSTSTTPRRRSTFYVPLVTSDATPDSRTNEADSTTATINFDKLKNLCDLKSSLENSKNFPNTSAIMTPTPCGFDWLTNNGSNTNGNKKLKNDLNDNDYIIIKTQPLKQSTNRFSNNANNLNNNNNTTKHSPIKITTTPTKSQQSKTKRYGIVLNGISLDDDMASVNGGVDNTQNATTLLNSLDYGNEDEDSEISRMQTNTSTPIKMMKSRSRTNILSVPVTERSLIITTVTTTTTTAVPIKSPKILKEKSKTLPQNLSPSIAMASVVSTNNVGSIANVSSMNSTNSNLTSNTFPPKNLFLLKSTPKLLPSAAPAQKNYSASDSSIQSPTPSTTTLSPPKKHLSFIRRAHSTKLSRSNSLLKSLTSSSSGSMKLQQQNSHLYLGYEVRPLPFDRLEKFYRSDRCAEMMKEYFMIKLDDNLQNYKDSDNENCSQITTNTAEDDDNAVHSDTSYEKACRRGSAPATPILGQKQQQSESHNTTSRFTNFFSKRSNPLKRTKSVTKLERAKRGPGGLRGSRSHESLLSSHAVMSTIDLSCTGAVGVAPVHQSVLGRRHCFQVRGGPRGERYYSCGSRQERDLWIYSLRKSIAPNAEHTRRTDNSLKMWIYEAKNMPAKKKYFCEINLDKTLYGRTSVKLQTDLLFWGEYFDFPDIPDINVITVNVYREIEKKKKRDKNVFVGSVKIPIHEVTSRLFSEDWYPILSEKHDSIGRNSSKEVIPTLRIKCRFQSIDILPVAVYGEFLQYVKENYKKICEILEPVIGVKAKEDIGQALVLLMHAQGMAGSFLTDVVALDLLRVGDQRLTFRGNSLATKSMEAFLKLTGEQYLQDTLSGPINEIIQSDRDCEVDPLKASGSLTRQQQALRNAVKSAWTSIAESHKHFPPQLRECFATFRERLQQLNREDMADNLISASIFLRFLCPAILSPSLFNITNELPSSRATRNLTLVAKTLQTLANFTRFQGKENFMEFLNDFLEQEAPNMKEFLHQISTRPEHAAPETILDWSGYIDQGKQLSILYQLLQESINKLPEARQRDLDPLQSILDDITKAKETNSYLQNQENQNPISQAPTARLVPAERGIMRGVLTPSSLEKNIFRYNDPTVSPLLRQTSNSQNSISNGSQYGNNNQMIQSQMRNSQSQLQHTHSQSQLQHSQSQSSIASSQNGILIPTTIQHHCPPSTDRFNQVSTYGSHHSNSNGNTHYFPSNGNLNGNHGEKMSPNVMRANTLPRNNGNYEEVGGNLIQIGLEPSSAFVRKSPTPLLKSSQSSVRHRIGSQLSLDRTPSKLNLGIPDATANHGSIISSSLLINNVQPLQQQNPNSNMPMNLEDLDDLLKYAEEHGNEKPKEKLTSKGSNVSIGHCSSGYQSINTPPSQSSSPIEQQQQQAQQQQVQPTDFGKRRLNNNNNNNINNNNNNKSVIQPPIAFKNPLYQLQQSSSASSSSSSSIQHPVGTSVAKYIFNGNGGKAALRGTSSSLTPSSSEERLSNDNYNSVGYTNHHVNSPISNHLDAHRTLSGSGSSSGGSAGRMPRTNPLMQYNNKRDDYSSHDNYLPINLFSERSVRDSRETGLYTNGHHHHHHNVNGNAVGQVNGVGLPVVNDSIIAQPRYQRRLSLDSARTLSDSSTDTEGVCHNAVEGKRRRPHQRSNDLSEIQRLQASLDTLRHKLDQDAAELRDSSDDIFELNTVGANKNGGSIASNASDGNMRSIIDRLISMEEELRREQLKMSLALSHKQRVIEAQGQQIAALDAANNRLLSALATLRQRYETQAQLQNQQSNGNC